MKNKIISFIYIILAILLLFGQIPVFAANEVQPDVSEKEAREVAAYYVKGYSKSINEWQGATIGNVDEYYTDERVSAYEFKVIKGEQEAGYIIISARKDWMPVLEFGTGSAPGNMLEKAINVAKKIN
jgi:hypothetical protein